ncbi:MAG: FRG domain-containing protein [candidate division NC10 bacterium]|nr:FRG domain-containing protein [candidate division NC10 bacterium]
MKEDTELCFQSAIGWLDGELQSWDAIVDEVKQWKGDWIFRALREQKECELREIIKVRLASSFDDACETGDVQSTDRWAYEAWMLREFKRAAHHYQVHLPEKNDLLEWLALARHYEMPSRLLDFTYSFYVACYFAMSGKPKGTAGCILAVNLSELKEATERVLCKRLPFMKESKRDLHNKDLFWKYAFCGRAGFVAPVNPGRKNERLIAQHGLFLCPADISRTFIRNLECTFDENEKKNLRLIVIAASNRAEVISNLNKMNISMATLYPELAGFAQSLRDVVHLKDPLKDDRFRSELKIAISKDPWF